MMPFPPELTGPKIAARLRAAAPAWLTPLIRCHVPLQTGKGISYGAEMPRLKSTCPRNYHETIGVGSGRGRGAARPDKLSGSHTRGITMNRREFLAGSVATPGVGVGAGGEAA